MDKIVWKYLKAGEVKHMFYDEKATQAICGVVSLWYLPSTGSWQEDDYGLSVRRECKLCPVRKQRDDEKEAAKARESEGQIVH